MKNNNVEVSFCLPVYNVKSYLEECLESILELKNKDISFEIICVDDCSTDGSYELLCEMAKENEEIKIFKNQSNKGVAYTRNKLIEKSGGGRIWFVDPDDLLISCNAAEVIKIALEKDADIVVGDFITIPENCSESNEAKESMDKFDCDFFVANEETMIYPHDQNGKTMPALWAGVLKKDFILQKNICFNEKLGFAEDNMFYFECAVNNPKFVKAKVNVYKYRVRKDSLTTDKSFEGYRRRYEAWSLTIKVFEKYLKDLKGERAQHLEKKILYTKQAATLNLSLIKKTSYVKVQLKHMKNQGLYPYQKIDDILKMKSFILKKWSIYFLPCEPLFWLTHFANKFL